MFSEIRNPQGEKLDFRFHQATSNADRKHVVVIGHGVTANLDRPWAEALADGLAAAGIHALRFSFSGNGDSEGDFRDSTVSKEVSDLGSVLDAIEAAGFTASYAGHSMGGAVGVIRTASDLRILHFVSLAGMVETKRFSIEEFSDQTPDSGFMWDDKDCPLSSAYMNDLAAIDSVASKAADIRVPYLLVHGTEDDLVPIAEARVIFQIANEPKKLVELEGVDHVFNGVGKDKMVSAVVGWLKDQLALA
ncbi:MAG: pimeloyl-ACP methyl ester carboxylesterase [Verrucomicrobiales bacterium]|jgi:pimeloyl-ACP methyl ester carboxylesterase